MRRISLVGIILMATIALTGCQGKKWFAPEPTGPEPSQIEILSHEISVEWWEYGEEWINEITGTAKNNSGQTCSPWILARFYDYDGVMVCESLDILGDMPAGETWAFKILYYGEKIKSYKVWVDRVT